YSTVSSVELAATALANLLEDKTVLPAFVPPREFLWVFFWGLALGSCAQLLSLQKALASIAALSAGYLLTAWALFRAAGLWLPLFVPLIWLAPTAVVGSVIVSHL